MSAACAIPGLLASGCAAANAAGSLVSDVASVASPSGALASVGTAVLDQIAGSFFTGWWALQAKVLTFWSHAPTPGPADLIAPGATRRWVAWLAQFTLVVSVLIAAGRTMVARDGRSLAEAGRTVVLTLLTSALVVTVAAALLAAGDAIAAALLGGALAEGAAADPQPLGSALLSVGGTPGMILTAALGTLVTLAQFFVLLSRNAILPVVIVLLPLAAAAGGAQLGRAWFSRLAAWLLALAFYKPIAAIIYSVVLVQTRTADDTLAALTALVGMCCAVLALPALIKLFSPSSAGAGGSGGGYAAGMAAATAVRAAATRGGSA